MANSKRYSRYQKKHGGPDYRKVENILPYALRYLSRDFILFLRTYTGDIRMFYEIFLEQVYRLPPDLLIPFTSSEELEFSGQSASSGASSDLPLVIVDAGANIGMAAKYFSLVYPSARIFCIEPDHRNFMLLQKNLAGEQEAGRAFFLEAALYERDGRVEWEDAGWSFNHKVSESGSGSDAKSQTIPAFTMERFLDQSGLGKVDLLKMDIEGAEEGLFKGDTQWLERVSGILIEIHTQTGIDLIKDRLTGQGFYWYPWHHSNSAASLFLASRRELKGNR